MRCTRGTYPACVHDFSVSGGMTCQLEGVGRPLFKVGHARACREGVETPGGRKVRGTNDLGPGPGTGNSDHRHGGWRPRMYRYGATPGSGCARGTGQKRSSGSWRRPPWRHHPGPRRDSGIVRIENSCLRIELAGGSKQSAQLGRHRRMKRIPHWLDGSTS